MEFAELTTVIVRGVETVQPLIDSRMHRLDISIAADSMLMHAERDRLTQVFGNFWQTQRSLGRPHYGGGSAPEMLENIFKLFVQAEHTASIEGGRFRPASRQAGNAESTG